MGRRVKMGCGCICALALSCGDGTPTQSVRSALSTARTDVRAQVREQLARSPAQLARVVHPDGTVSVRVRSGFQHATLVVRRPDGTRDRGCFDDAERALRWLEGGP